MSSKAKIDCGPGSEIFPVPADDGRLDSLSASVDIAFTISRWKPDCDQNVDLRLIVHRRNNCLARSRLYLNKYSVNTRHDLFMVLSVRA